MSPEHVARGASLGLTYNGRGQWREASSGALVAWPSLSVPGTWFSVWQTPHIETVREFLDGVPLPPVAVPDDSDLELDQPAPRAAPVAVTRETLTPRWVDALTPSQRTKLLERLAAADPALVARVRAEVLGG